jgi:chlorite dismutase
MRFDEVSARFGEFGPFVTGLLLEPSDLMRHLGILRA